jgi:pyrroloquinoline-quinone synthase
VDFFAALEDVRQRWNVLQHPFYERWSRGELSREELAAYSGQYRHAVVALAEASDAAARAAEPEIQAGLDAHAQEEAAHVALWDGFVDAVGGDSGAEPNAETAECARVWADADRSFLGTLVALYAIESGQPAISETKRDGLAAHYGLAEGPAVEYFELHARRDHEHAAEARALVEPRLAGADVDALLAEAERVLEANWGLLDGVERDAGR